MTGGSTTSSTNSGASSTRGSPGMSAIATPTMTSRIEGARSRRRAITATAASTASKGSRVWMATVIGSWSGRTHKTGGDVDGECQQRDVEEERDDGMHGDRVANGFRRHANIGDLRGHADAEGEIDEVPVVRLVVAGEHQRCSGAAVSVTTIVFVGIVQGEDGVDQRPGEEDGRRGEQQM